MLPVGCVHSYKCTCTCMCMYMYVCAMWEWVRVCVLVVMPQTCTCTCWAPCLLMAAVTRTAESRPASHPLPLSLNGGPFSAPPSPSQLTHTRPFWHVGPPQQSRRLNRTQKLKAPAQCHPRISYMQCTCSRAREAESSLSYPGMNPRGSAVMSQQAYILYIHSSGCSIWLHLKSHRCFVS